MLGASSVSENGCKMTKVKRRTALVEKVKKGWHLAQLQPVDNELGHLCHAKGGIVWMWGIDRLREEQKFWALLSKASLMRIMSVKQTEVLMNRVVRENAKQGLSLVASDSNSPHSQRDTGLYGSERVRSADRQKRGLKTNGAIHRAIYLLFFI